MRISFNNSIQNYNNSYYNNKKLSQPTFGDLYRIKIPGEKYAKTLQKIQQIGYDKNISTSHYPFFNPKNDVLQLIIATGEDVPKFDNFISKAQTAGNNNKAIANSMFKAEARKTLPRIRKTTPTELQQIMSKEINPQ